MKEINLKPFYFEKTTPNDKILKHSRSLSSLVHRKCHDLKRIVVKVGFEGFAENKCKQHMLADFIARQYDKSRHGHQNS